MTNEKKETKKETKREKHDNIYSALSAFQGDLPTVPKKKQVKFKTKGGNVINFKYAPLGTVIKTISPYLKKHGLSFQHQITTRNGNSFVECVVTHETYKRELEIIGTEKIHEEVGEAKRTEVTNKREVKHNQISSGLIKINQNKKDMTDVASEITYAKRYTLGLVLGIASEEDKDAKQIRESYKKARGFAFNRTKKSIKNCKSLENLETKEKMVDKELNKLENEKSTSLGLQKEDYKELKEMINKKREELEENEDKEEKDN